MSEGSQENLLPPDVRIHTDYPLASSFSSHGSFNYPWNKEAWPYMPWGQDHYRHSYTAHQHSEFPPPPPLKIAPHLAKSHKGIDERPESMESFCGQGFPKSDEQRAQLMAQHYPLQQHMMPISHDVSKQVYTENILESGKKVLFVDKMGKPLATGTTGVDGRVMIPTSDQMYPFSMVQPNQNKLMKIAVPRRPGINPGQCLMQKFHAGFEILPRIFKYLPVPDLINASKVCRLWRSLIDTPALVSSIP